jgi:hypothetical protein
VTSTGTNAGSIKEQWIYDGATWVLVQGSYPVSSVVIDNTIANPSSATVIGRYIVPTTGLTGVFVGNANKYADYDGTTWTFTTPTTNTYVSISNGVNANQTWMYNGTTWAQTVASPSLNVPNWTLNGSYVAGDCRLYTDGQPYLANGTIAANTAFAIGTTGATWRPIMPLTTSSTVTANAGTTTLATVNELVCTVTGTTTHTIKLPPANLLQIGAQFTIINSSTGTITFQNNAAVLLRTLAALDYVTVSLSNNTTAAGVWNIIAYGNIMGAYYRLDGTSLPVASLNMNSNKVTGMANPTAAQDGMTLSYANSAYYKLDGTSAPTAALNMNSQKITGLADPSAAQDAVTRNYADTLRYMTANPIMTANTTVIDGLTYIATSNSAHPTYPQWKCFNNLNTGVDGWVTDTNNPNNVWVQLQYPASLSMSGFYICARNYGGRSITSWKVQASNDGTTFTDIVPANTTLFDAGFMNKFTFTASAKYAYWRFYIITSTGSTDVGVATLQWIPTSSERFLKKNSSGYIPKLTSNTNYLGFTPSASSELNASWIAANAFAGVYGTDWATAGVSTNFWLKIACPNAVRIWKIALRGKNGNAELIYNWRIEASNDNSVWSIVYTAPNPTNLNNTYQEFLFDSVSKFQYYRINRHQCTDHQPRTVCIPNIFIR